MSNDMERGCLFDSRNANLSAGCGDSPQVRSFILQECRDIRINADAPRECGFFFRRWCGFLIRRIAKAFFAFTCGGENVPLLRDWREKIGSERDTGR